MRGYKLDGNDRLVRCDPIEALGADRVIEKTEIREFEVSTVCLGVPHLSLAGLPDSIYETMVFRDGKEVWIGRWFTIPQARRGHAEIVDEILANPEKFKEQND